MIYLTGKRKRTVKLQNRGAIIMRDEKKNDKVTAIYKAVQELVEEGADFRTLRVSDVSAKAGIGKGTTYEYFSSKEEMIVKAVSYSSYIMVTHILAEMKKETSFKGKFMIMLKELEEKIKQRACIFRYLNMISEEGVYKELCAELINDVEAKNSHPMRVISYLVDEGIKEGVLGNSFSKNYMEVSVFSKIIAFSMYTDTNLSGENCRIEEMKQQLYLGICRELGA